MLVGPLYPRQSIVGCPVFRFAGNGRGLIITNVHFVLWTDRLPHPWGLGKNRSIFGQGRKKRTSRYFTNSYFLVPICALQRNGRYFAQILIDDETKFQSDGCGFQEEDSAVGSAAKSACICLKIPLHVPVPGRQCKQWIILFSKCVD